LSGTELMDRLVHLIPMILSLSVHEWAHAWSARRLGDDTATRMGRMTLNPIAHIDPIGTLLLPMLGVPFGWARPVPIDPTRFRRDISMSKGMAITASAGPISNLLLTLLMFGLLAAQLRFLPELGFPPDVLPRAQAVGQLFQPDVNPVQGFLTFAMVMNLALAIFNLVPVYPLDGSRIAAWLVPDRMRGAWHAWERMAPFLLLGLIFFGRNLISGPIVAVLGPMFHALNVVGSTPLP
jgi:Zn-dependent protease